MVVYVGEDHALPLVDLSITVRAGAFLDDPAKPGVATLTGRMVRRGGTKTLSAEDFDEKADFLAAQISSFGGDISSGASFNCTTQTLDACLDLFFDMIQNPAFEVERLDLEKENILEGLKQRNDDAGTILGREWGWLMRGRDHFTARQLTAAELDAITRDDLVAFHKKYWLPKNMMVTVSGDVDTGAILDTLAKRFAPWKSEGPEVPWPPAAPDHTPRPGVYYVDKDIPQGKVYIGHLGIQDENWNHPDRFAVALMNEILGGGGFTSRITNRVRSDEGLAYSAGSVYRVGRFWPGMFRIVFQSKSATVPLAAKIALEEVRRIQNEPVSQEELDIAKAAFIDTFPQAFESIESIVNTFADDEYTGRPRDYWKKYRDRVRAVTAKDVQKAARKYLHPDQVVFLVVGKWDEIVKGDPDGRATMKEFFEGRATRLPLRDPLTLEPLP
ncbi:MAG: pitrilysin family protein [Acidobacteriota bacterium]|nr:pitrilysin family protein [Acidobacteriota bacterium]